MTPKGRNWTAGARLLAIQFLLSFSDNALRSAFGFIVTFQGEKLFRLSAEVSLMLGALALAAPYFLISGLSGVLADRVPRNRIILFTRTAEIPLALVTGSVIYVQNAPLLLVCLFIYSIQSAIFTTAKLAYVPQIIALPHLTRFNAQLQTASLSGILLGLLAGGLAIANDLGLVMVLGLIAISIIGYLMARALPDATEVASPSAHPMGPNLVRSATAALSSVLATHISARVAIGISWFWVTGLVLTSLLPDVAKDILGISANTANVLIAAFVLGIALGAILLSRFARIAQAEQICLAAALGMAAFQLDLAYSLLTLEPPSLTAMSLVDFIAQSSGARILFDLIGIATCGALYLAPFYTRLQTLPAPSGRALFVSGSITLDALASTGIAAALAVAFSLGLTFVQLLVVMALCNLAIAVKVKGLNTPSVR